MITLFKICLSKLTILFFYFKNRVKKSIFLKQVGTVGLGTVSAQILSLLSIPILTRYYTPIDFAALALIGAIARIFMPVASGRYELAIVVSQSERESIQITNLAILLTFLTFIVFTILQLTFDEYLRDLFKAHSLGGYFYLIPLIIFTNAIFTICRNFSNSRKEYKNISYFTFVKSFLIAFFSIFFGLFLYKFEISGLIVSLILSVTISSVLYIRLYENEITIDKIKFDKIKYSLMKKYKSFPLLNLPSSLLNTISLSMHIILLNKYFEPTIVGYYALVSKVIVAPLRFISSSFSQVNLKKVTELIKHNVAVLPYLFKLIALLTIIITPSTLVLMIWGENLMSIVFGEQWKDSGKIVSIMAPAFAIRFVVSIISNTISASGNLKYYGIWTIFDITQLFLVFYYFANRLDTYEFFFVFCLSTILSYSLYLLAIILSSKKIKKY